MVFPIYSGAFVPYLTPLGIFLESPGAEECCLTVRSNCGLCYPRAVTLGV